MDTSAKRIIERIKVLAQIGYQNFVVAPTFYVTANLPSELLRLFGECKEHSAGMNMIAYNIPSTHRLHDSVRSDGGDGPARLDQLLSRIAPRTWTIFIGWSAEAVPLGLRVFLGTERKASEALQTGAVGLVPTCANFEPSTFLAAYEARGNKEELARLQIRITELVENLLLAPRLWLAGMKYAVSTMG